MPDPTVAAPAAPDNAIPASTLPPPPPSQQRSLSDVIAVEPRSEQFNPNLLPVPNVPIPSRGAPPRPAPTSSQLRGTFKVMVEARSSNQASVVRSLYPDAFPTVHNDRALLQVGIFSSRDKAEQILENLKNKGLEGLIVPL
ncbi:MAG: SPOR domain-containing protein [Chloroflexaceae bacterium]|nr:SPOR domain-containing protein [Chloroflexaceae bacterium]